MYRLKLPHSWKIHPVFHVSLLRPAHIDSSLHPDPTTDQSRPPPDLIKGIEEYEVNRILDHHHGKRRRQYLVKWKGYPESEATWEKASDLKHAPDAVHDYLNTLS